jgi:DNA-binding Lrp family transcriptional regulator
MISFEMSKSEKVVLDVIKNHVRETKCRFCSLSVREIEDILGCSTTTVKAAIKVLCASGKIQKYSCANEEGKWQRNNCYELLVD